MRFVVCAILLLAACNAGNDSERTGDIAWRDGRWPDAMAAYKDAGNIPRALAKYADAAFHGGFLPEAVAGWRQFGTLAPARASEAAAGLMRIALEAERQRDQVVLASAVAAIRVVAPDWPTGRLVRQLEGDRGLSPADAELVWPVLVGAAPQEASASVALLGFGRVETTLGNCSSALSVFQSLARRTPVVVNDTVVVAMAPCEVRLGVEALAQSRVPEADGWFSKAVSHDPEGSAGRRALLGLGDVRLQQGDLASALIAWRSIVTAPVPHDSIFDLAMQRLQTAQPTSPDSSETVSGWY